MLKYFLVLGGLLIATAAQAANQPQLLGEYGDWTAWTYNDRGNVICYMASSPKKDEGKYTKRGDIYTVVTHRPAEKTYDEVSIVAGYVYNPKATLTIKIGNETFRNTFTDGDKGWMVNNAEDQKIVKAMKRGERMIVDGQSSRGTATKDTYSLKGFTSAYQAISAKCKKK
jgi:invasion protein IalB